MSLCHSQKIKKNSNDLNNANKKVTFTSSRPKLKKKKSQTFIIIVNRVSAKESGIVDFIVYRSTTFSLPQI